MTAAERYLADLKARRQRMADEFDTDIGPTCTHLRPGMVPKPCGEPAEWEYAQTFEGNLPTFRCKRHVPKDLSLWRRLRDLAA